MANKKAEILTMDGQVVSPITLATNVLLDDGRTAQDLLDSRDESMFSPTITTSSSISKVGQGDNVDFSENIIDGAYKSCVLKGKTLVNHNAEGNNRNEYACMPSLEGSNLTVNDTVESKVKSAILKGNTLVNLMTGFLKEEWVRYYTPGVDANVANVSMFKPNTEYTLFYKAKHEVEGNSGSLHICLTDDIAERINTKHSYSTEYQQYVFKFTTPSSPNYFVFRSNAHYFLVKECVLLEGYYTNVDIPYFEGMQSVRKI